MIAIVITAPSPLTPPDVSTSDFDQENAQPFLDKPGGEDILLPSIIAICVVYNDNCNWKDPHDNIGDIVVAGRRKFTLFCLIKLKILIFMGPYAKFTCRRAYQFSKYLRY